MSTKERSSFEFTAQAKNLAEQTKLLKEEGGLLLFKILSKISPDKIGQPVEFGTKKNPWPLFGLSVESLAYGWLEARSERSVTFTLPSTDRVCANGEEIFSDAVVVIQGRAAGKRVTIWCNLMELGGGRVRPLILVQKPCLFKIDDVAVNNDEFGDHEMVNQLDVLQILCVLAQKYAEELEK